MHGLMRWCETEFMIMEELVGECFDLKEQRKILDKLYDKTMTSIQIEFYQGRKNLPNFYKQYELSVHLRLPYTMLVYETNLFRSHGLSVQCAFSP